MALGERVRRRNATSSNDAAATGIATAANADDLAAAIGNDGAVATGTITAAGASDPTDDDDAATTRIALRDQT